MRNRRLFFASKPDSADEFAKFGARSGGASDVFAVGFKELGFFTNNTTQVVDFVAEGVGFEPTVRLLVRLISSQHKCPR
jgi:hypothetical protein